MRDLEAPLKVEAQGILRDEGMQRAECFGKGSVDALAGALASPDPSAALLTEADGGPILHFGVQYVQGLGLPLRAFEG